MYPTMALEVHTNKGWEKVEGTEASNRPHHYDVLREKFNSLVKQAKPFSAHFVNEFGYRISSNGRTVDSWMAHDA